MVGKICKTDFRRISFLHSKMANVQTCVGIKADGTVCGKVCRGQAVRCATHLKTIENNGPNFLAVKEMGYIHKKQIRDIEARYTELLEAVQDFEQRRNLREDEINEIRILRANQDREMTQLVRQQRAEVIRTGIDPDAPARERARIQREERDRERQRLWNERLQLVNAGFAQNQQNNNIQRIVNAPVQQAPRLGELGRFANDAQNIHTTVAVQQTKDMVNRILKISVPNDYKWNARTCSKTPGEIITECSLSAKGAWQMVAKYCQDESVYDMGTGIYGKTLDGVWQYIVNSSDKRDLCRILRQEMEDNVGMCAQGNLTRLCNILAGYMEGIGVQESPAEILGRKLPMLAEIEDQATRLNEAFKLLIESGVPQSQWLSWVEPLVEQGVAQLRANAAGQVIGIEAI